MSQTTPVPSQVAELSATLSQPKPMRRGSIHQRHMKCGQADCACQRDPNARHGPYFTITRAVDGKTQSRYISAEQLPTARRQIEAGRQFRRQLEAYWTACEAWADAELEPTGVAARSGAEKKGFARGSQRRSPRRSSNC